MSANDQQPPKKPPPPASNSVLFRPSTVRPPRSTSNGGSNSRLPSSSTTVQSGGTSRLSQTVARREDPSTSVTPVASGSRLPGTAAPTPTTAVYDVHSQIRTINERFFRLHELQRRMYRPQDTPSFEGFAEAEAVEAERKWREQEKKRADADAAKISSVHNDVATRIVEVLKFLIASSDQIALTKPQITAYSNPATLTPTPPTPTSTSTPPLIDHSAKYKAYDQTQLFFKTAIGRLDQSVKNTSSQTTTLSTQLHQLSTDFTQFQAAQSTKIADLEELLSLADKSLAAKEKRAAEEKKVLEETLRTARIKLDQREKTLDELLKTKRDPPNMDEFVVALEKSLEEKLEKRLEEKLEIELAKRLEVELGKKMGEITKCVEQNFAARVAVLEDTAIMAEVEVASTQTTQSDLQKDFDRLSVVVTGKSLKRPRTDDGDDGEEVRRLGPARSILDAISTTKVLADRITVVEGLQRQENDRLSVATSQQVVDIRNHLRALDVAVSTATNSSDTKIFVELDALKSARDDTAQKMREVVEVVKILARTPISEPGFIKEVTELKNQVSSLSVRAAELESASTQSQTESLLEHLRREHDQLKKEYDTLLYDFTTFRIHTNSVKLHLKPVLSMLTILLRSLMPPLARMLQSNIQNHQNSGIGQGISPPTPPAE